MTLDEVMTANDGKWADDVATVRQGMYVVRLATRNHAGEITLTDEGLRAFPGLVVNATSKKQLTKASAAKVE